MPNWALFGPPATQAPAPSPRKRLGQLMVPAHGKPAFPSAHCTRHWQRCEHWGVHTAAGRVQTAAVCMASWLGLLQCRMPCVLASLLQSRLVDANGMHCGWRPLWHTMLTSSNTHHLLVYNGRQQLGISHQGPTRASPGPYQGPTRAPGPGARQVATAGAARAARLCSAAAGTARSCCLAPIARPGRVLLPFWLEGRGVDPSWGSAGTPASRAALHSCASTPHPDAPKRSPLLPCMHVAAAKPPEFLPG